MAQSQVLGVLLGGMALGVGLGVGGTLVAKRTGTPSEVTSPNQSTCSLSGLSGEAKPLLELDGAPVDIATLPADVRDTLYQIESGAYDQLSAFIKELALRLVLAKEQKIDVTRDLPPLASLMGVNKIPDSEIKKFYEQNKGRLPPGATYEQIKPQIQQFMANQALGQAVKNRVEDLENKGRIKILKEPPMAPVVALDLQGFPSRGPTEAAVTVVEVSDYMCPHCRTMKTEVDTVLKEFAGKVRFVQVNFPLMSEGLSGTLVRGGYCVQQMKPEAFWSYHEKAFALPFEAQRPVSPNAAKEFMAHATTLAKEAGVAVGPFEQCVSSEETKKAVEAYVAKMTRVGVSATPTLFVNNQKVGLGSAPLRKAIKAALGS